MHLFQALRVTRPPEASAGFTTPDDRFEVLSDFGSTCDVSLSALRRHDDRLLRSTLDSRLAVSGLRRRDDLLFLSIFQIGGALMARRGH